MQTPTNNKAVFLDRDGVINIDKFYVYKIEEFEFKPGIFSLLSYFQELQYKIIIITNQSGIGRGEYTEEDFHKLTNWMLDQFSQNGVTINKVYYSPYHKEFGRGEYKKDSFLRKPNPGMILLAQEEFHLDLSRCLLIGDKETDIQAGINAGIPINILITSEQNPKTNATIVVQNLTDIISRLSRMIRHKDV